MPRSSWELLDDPRHRGVQTLVGDLNRVYVGEPALHATDGDPSAFAWAVADDEEASVYAFTRRAGNGTLLLVVANMTPMLRQGYRIGVPAEGHYAEVVNTDAQGYGGGNRGNGGGASTQSVPARGHAQSLTLTLPPLATLILKKAP